MRAGLGCLLVAAVAAALSPALAEEPRASVEDVRRLAAQGDVDTAAGLAAVLLSERPRDVDLHVVYQDLQVQVGSLKELQRAYRERAQAAGATADDAYLHARLLDEKAAIAEHRRTLRTDQGHLRTLLALGDLYLARGELGDAEQVLRGAVAAGTDLAAPRLGLAETLRRAGDLEQAEATLREAVAKEPRCVLAHVELGVLLAELALYDEARTRLVAAADIDPRDPLPHLALGHLERMLGRDRMALEQFEARRRAEIDAAAARAAEAAEKAAEEARKAADAGNPPPEPPKKADPASREDVGTASLRALKAFEKAVDLDPRSFPGLILVAHAASMAGDGLTAQSSLLTARGLYPDAHEPGTFRARLQLDNEQVAEAEVTANRVVDAHRDLAVALYLRGVARSRLGGARKAEKDLERAAQASGDHPLYLRGLAAHHAANGRWRDALAVLQKVVRATEAAPHAVYELAVVQRGAGKPKDAASSLEALVAGEPDYRDGWLLLGRICYEDLRKMEDRALECFLRFQELGGTHDELELWIADLQAR